MSEMLIVAIIAVVIYIIYHILLVKEFKEKYNLDYFPQNIQIHRTLFFDGRNYYDLKYPTWTYSNKDGTCDKRRKDNAIIYKKSKLLVDGYKVVSKNPIAILEILYCLRIQNVEIEKSQLEKIKIQDKLNEKKRLHDMNSIDNLILSFADNPYDFEDFCVMLYQKMGFKAEATARTNDGGYDIVLEYPNAEKGIVECKCYNRTHSVGRPLIQKLVGANQVVKAQHMIFITTSNFSSSAIEYAKESHVELVDGNKLLNWTHQFIKPEKIELNVEPEEWTLNREDIKKYIPSDIYQKL